MCSYFDTIEPDTYLLSRRYKRRRREKCACEIPNGSIKGIAEHKICFRHHCCRRCSGGMDVAQQAKALAFYKAIVLPLRQAGQAVNMDIELGRLTRIYHRMIEEASKGGVDDDCN